MAHIVRIYVDLLEKDRRRCERIRNLSDENYFLRRELDEIDDDSAKTELSDLQDLLFDLKEDIPEGKYIKIMDKTKLVYEKKYISQSEGWWHSSFNQ